MTTRPTTRPPRALWAAVVMLIALLASCAVGALSWWGGANGPHAVLAAGAAFSGGTLFGFAVFDFVTGRRA